MRYIIPISEVSEAAVENACMLGFGMADMIELWCKNIPSFEFSHSYQYIGKLKTPDQKLIKWMVDSRWFVDIDFKNDLEFVEQVPKNQLLLSFHDFKNVPTNLDEIVKKMESYNPEIYKISVTVETNDELSRFLLWTKKVHQNHTFIFTTMGKLGSDGRVKLWKEGYSYAHFSPTEESKKTEDSQLTLDQWQSLF